MTTDRGWQDGDIDFSMLEGFMQSLSGQIPNERISQLTRLIGDELRAAGVVHARLGNRQPDTGQADRTGHL
jgi:hypothetical protein